MQRRTASRDGTGAAHGSSSSAASLQRLKHLDIYARPKSEFQRTTMHGAIVSLLLGVLVNLLIWRELRFSMRTETVERLFVNSTVAPEVTVTFDVIFPRIACGFLSIDTEDHTGIPQAGASSDITRVRLDLDGRLVGPREEHELGNTLKEVLAEESESEDSGAREGDECNCYGAGSEGDCCRTCDDIKAAYRRRGWKLNAAEIPICVAEKTRPAKESDLGGESTKEDEGCRMAGTLQMTKTQGNFHFAPGRRLHRRVNSMNVMDKLQVATERFNTTHTIVSLSFGNHSHPASDSKMDPASSSILEGHEKIVQDAHAMHQYYLQLVPTTYRFLDGTTVYGSQYSVTEHLRHVASLRTGSGLPGVYFYYEVSPVQSLMEERRPGILSFLTNTCGVVGGMYSLLGLVNTGIDGLTKRRKRLS